MSAGNWKSWKASTAAWKTCALASHPPRRSHGPDRCNDRRCREKASRELKRDVVWSSDALDDFDGAVRYIAHDNPIAPRSVATEIREAGRRLGDMATGKPGRRTGTYEKVVADLPYILAYALHFYPEIGETVVILRVTHTLWAQASDLWLNIQLPGVGGVFEDVG